MFCVKRLAFLAPLRLIESFMLLFGVVPCVLVSSCTRPTVSQAHSVPGPVSHAHSVPGPVSQAHCVPSPVSQARNVPGPICPLGRLRTMIAQQNWDTMALVRYGTGTCMVDGPSCSDQIQRHNRICEEKAGYNTLWDQHTEKSKHQHSQSLCKTS